MLTWREEQKPNAAWARRYGGDLPAVMKFIDESEQQQRRLAPLILPLFNCTLIVLSAVFFAGLWSFFYAGMAPSDKIIQYGISVSPWYTLVAYQSAFAAVTCAFGLWRYSGLAFKRAVLAGALILAAGFVADAVLTKILLSLGFSFYASQYWWNATLAAPCWVTALAIFDPVFRRPRVWTLLVLVYCVGFVLPYEANNDTYAGAAILVWLIWCVVFGLQLRRVGDMTEVVEYRPKFAAVKLAAFFCFAFLCVIALLRILDVHVYHYGRLPLGWLVDLIGSRPRWRLRLCSALDIIAGSS